MVNAIVNNMLIYTMDRPENGGLPLEAMGHYGDSGSGALLFEHDGTFDEDGFPQGKRWIIGKTLRIAPFVNGRENIMYVPRVFLGVNIESHWKKPLLQ